MGNESSSNVVDEKTHPSVLEKRTIEAVAKYVLEKDVRRIVVMVGAGISTSAGIPDFRSPDTGIYSNLAYLDLPDPEAVFDISFFRENPKPFYTLAREIAPGRYRPTIAHSFIKLLYDKGRLLKHFSQNIDCLERLAGVPGEMIVEAHGSFATQRCIDCKADYPGDQMKAAIAAGEVPHCQQCNGLVKPDIVFFGEALPSDFFDSRDLPEQADLCIVMGTSLTVQPFASLPQFCRDGVPRVLINMERVGGLGSRPDDVLVLGDCDTGVRRLARALGWEEELEALWEATNLPEECGAQTAEATPLRTREEKLQEEVERLTEEVDRTLGISQEYEKRVRQQLGGPVAGTADRADRTNPANNSESSHAGETSTDRLAHVFPHLARTTREGRPEKA
ncbi:SIR2 family NAD-dependent protein deacylase [Aspergillus saccharolyticus JOP 1030-1]|uniref:NAD-dependent protein deacetylase n=1 Tax=Aspergillus saccharolyticus JOP 1030-1 TaxID=1450539 RepID=A0A318ZJR8_9EURO|nr:NAD-dependent deacetylase sirtuin-2 [Aspergillus saccharolyticus JOP 1030-1]PYH47746.1 NAD-dependent deacetylase sirtuin-2 [Aspergillus saccharolyticus JOP 1030-1]